MPRFVRLLIRAAAVPVGFEVAVGGAMFLTDGFVSQLLALVFVLSAVGAVFLWVIKNVGASVSWFSRAKSEEVESGSVWVPPPLEEKSAIDQLAFAARSQILYSILVGYVLIALVFGLAYHAVEGSSGGSLTENLYFSLTTLSTVGYGDVAPKGFGRVLAGTEMVVGVAFNVLAIGGGTAFLLRLSSQTDKH